MIAVVLAGGSGTRLWPLSRQQFPKQFLPLLGERSLLQDTVERVRPLVGDEVRVVTTAETAFLVGRQLRDLGLDPVGRVLAEPCGRNTAPAIGLAALSVPPETVLLVLPSDHAIRDPECFRDGLRAAEEVAAAGHLVTFGIAPSRAETGYGYIRLGRELEEFAGFRSADAFVEKPDRETAERYLAGGGYVWNSGMFAFRADRLLEELALHAPEVHRGLQSLRPHLERGRPVPAEDYATLPRISVDYAVMEGSDRVVVLPLDPGWSDLGSFEALFDLLPATVDGNTVRCGARGMVSGTGSRGNLVWCGDKHVALIGMEGTVVVDTPDALLVCRRERSQEVRQVAESLAAADSAVALRHTTDHRPWGSFTVLEEGDGYKVKRIQVVSGARLSLQFHRRRAEHWVVLRGVAGVTLGDDAFDLHPGQCVAIEREVPHRVENRGSSLLEFVEVQRGDYLGEDDIVRLDDDYGRIP